jgi:senataxin
MRTSASTAVVAGRVSGSTDKTPSKKILVCAPSNAAIDEVASRIRDLVVDSKPIKVVRCGADKALNLSVKDIALDNIVDERLSGSETKAKDQNEEYSRLVEKLASIRKMIHEKENEASVLTDNTARAKAIEDERQNLISRRWDISRQINGMKDKFKSETRTLDSKRRNLRNQVLWEADVICSTLSGAGHEMLEHLDFEMIIIDEAAQAIELSTLIPLKFNCARCIMVGGRCL